MMRITLVLGSMLWMYSCVSSDMHMENAEQYFDVTDFIAAEQLTATGKEMQIEKTVIFQEQRETKQVAFAEYDSSLQLLAGLNLNTELYAGKVQADTIITDDNTLELQYTVNDEDLPIHYCSVQIVRDSVSELRIITEEKNLLYTTHKEYLYKPRKELLISIQQKTIMYGLKSYSLHYTMVQ